VGVTLSLGIVFIADIQGGNKRHSRYVGGVFVWTFDVRAIIILDLIDRKNTLIFSRLWLYLLHI